MPPEDADLADLKFYEVDASYIDYLLKVDSRVPHVDYSESSQHDKFLCGIVLTVKKIPLMVQNCCDFTKLEAACEEYAKKAKNTDNPNNEIAKIDVDRPKRQISTKKPCLRGMPKLKLKQKHTKLVTKRTHPTRTTKHCKTAVELSRQPFIAIICLGRVLSISSFIKKPR